MSTISLKHQSRTQLDADILQWAHGYLLRKAAPQTEDDWFAMCFKIGCQFAADFANTMPKDMIAFIEQLLLATPATVGESNNLFWTWWRVKYMQDDYDFVHNKVYELQNYTYLKYKLQMLESALLESELENYLYDNTNYLIINKKNTK